MSTLTRREFLKYSGGAVLLAALGSPALAACQTAPPLVKADGRVASTGLAAGLDSARSSNPGSEARARREFDLTAAVTPVDLGTGEFMAWTYNGQALGPEIRVTEDDVVRVAVTNNLPDPTTVHWHGVPVPNAMDGVPDITQPPIQPGETFIYEFVAWPSGTYWYHPHVGHQLDRGLVGPLIIDPKHELGDYDREYTLLLDDWVTVDGGAPAVALRGAGGMMSGGMMGGGMMHNPRQGDGGGNGPLQEPTYNAFAVNGQVADAAAPLSVRQGERVRLRLINAGGATVFALRLAGHALTVTHADGRPVEPMEVDVLRIGMGERYDVVFTADNPGRWKLYDLLNGGSAYLTLATFVYQGSAATRDSGDTLSQRYRWNDYRLLVGLPEEGMPPLEPTQDAQAFNMVLTGGHMSPYWGINGKIYPDTDKVVLPSGQRVRFDYFNQSPMAHPMHLHGHFFEVVGSKGLRKDTLIVEGHMGRASIEFIADNPGDWMHHCHNIYHAEAGMMNIVRVSSE
jgi:FtsP/CotA-like multicopper oxidase with cupredoxin domain